MSVRTLVAVAGPAGAGLVILGVAGPAVWTAAVAVPLLAVAAAAGLARRPAGPVLNDASGERLSVGDIVRGGAGFDGPMELAFGRGVVVKVGQGKAHVRFNDIPGQVHPVTPSGLRRIS